MNLTSNVVNKLQLAIAVFFVVIIILLQIALAYMRNDAHIIYPLDDTYIHLSIAKNVAQYGVWGISPKAFASASSSPLYTLTLAMFYKYMWSSDMLPLVLNIILCIMVLYVIYYINLMLNLNGLCACILYFGIIVFTPLPAVAISGMEHVLQILIDLVYVCFCLNLLVEEKYPDRFHLLILCVLSALVSAVRYEGMFLIVIISGGLLLRRRFLAAFLAVLSSLVPIAGFGCYAVNQGSHFLPNSILLKGYVPTFQQISCLAFLRSWMLKLSASLHLVSYVIFILFGLVALKGRRLSGRIKVLAGISISLVVMHTMFSAVGWFYRYEAYIVAICTIAFVGILNEMVYYTRFKLVVIACAICLLFFPVIYRAATAIIYTPNAMSNIYEQQYQMARFVKAYYDNEVIAIHDIGAISYFSNAKIFDLFGLASNVVLMMRFNHAYSPGNISRLISASGVRLIMIYDNWFRPCPGEWIKVGEWTITNNVVCNNPTVSFYATDSSGVEYLVRSLKEFSISLPHSVAASGLYLK